MSGREGLAVAVGPGDDATVFVSAPILARLRVEALEQARRDAVRSRQVHGAAELHGSLPLAL